MPITRDPTQEIERLRTLVEASKLINSSIEDEDLFDSILGVARRELDVERGTLYFVQHERGEIWSKIASGLDAAEIRLPIGKGIAGSVAATGQTVLLDDVYTDPRFDRSLDERSGFHTSSMLCVPIKNRDGKIVGVLQLLNKRRGPFGQDDLDFLESLSDHMAIAMENAVLHRTAIERNRMQKELQLGREIQARLLPPPPSDVPDTELVAQSLSCFEVGGDYYDFIELPGGEVGLTIADVSGKGVAAALIMSSIQAALRVAAPSEPDLTRLARRLNGLLYRMTTGRKYVTFFFGRFDPVTGMLRYVNAGHNPPLLIDGASRHWIATTGRPIGLLPNEYFEEGSVKIPNGATLVLYTDGFVEASDPSDQEFGMERWEELVASSIGRPIAEVPRILLDAITRFENGAPALDDKTLVVLRRR